MARETGGEGEEGEDSRGQKGQRRGVVKAPYSGRGLGYWEGIRKENLEIVTREGETVIPGQGGNIKTPNGGWGFSAPDRKASLCRES